MDTYGHPIPGANRQAVDRLDDAPIRNRENRRGGFGYGVNRNPSFYLVAGGGVGRQPDTRPSLEFRVSISYPVSAPHRT